MMNSRVAIRRFLRVLCSLVAAGIVALPIVSCGGNHSHSAGAGFTLEVTPAVASITKGTSVQLVATALNADGTKQDVTSSVAWSSSDLSIATVDSGEYGGGLVLALVPGTATITARLPGALGTTALTVTAQ